jgi:hypothetical protein
MVAFVFLWLFLSAGFEGIAALLPTWLIVSLVIGLSARKLMEQRAQHLKKQALKKNLSGEEALEFMRRHGRPSWAGMGLYGALSAFGILAFYPAFGPHHHDMQSSFRAVMKSDLRNLVTAEESYFADHVTYTTSFRAMSYSPSTGVAITIGAVNDSGWSATAKHDRVPALCTIWVGLMPPAMAGTYEGQPTCDGPQAVSDHHE